jgi:hypothetical protein
VPLHYNDNVTELISSAVEHSIITRAGAWFTVDGVGKYNGTNELISTLRGKEDVVQKLLQELSERLGFPVSF